MPRDEDGMIRNGEVRAMGESLDVWVGVGVWAWISRCQSKRRETPVGWREESRVS